MNDEKLIIDFWDNIELYKSNGIDTFKQKAREFYSEEFMNKYTKWSDNLSELNKTMIAHMTAGNFPMQFWEEMSYDWFCTKINALIEEWITVNKDITIADISIITQKLIADYIATRMSEFTKKAYTITSLLESIKKPIMMVNKKDTLI